MEATANHPFMTFDGWTPLGELKVGDRLAVPRRVPEPVHTQRMDDSEIILLAHMIGDGSCVKRQPIRYASIDEANLAAVTTAAQHFGVTAVRDDYPAARVTTLRLPAPYRPDARQAQSDCGMARRAGPVRQAELREVCAARGFRAPQRSGGAVPAASMGDGWLGALGCEGTDKAQVYYASTSRRLVDDVMQLLLALGHSLLGSARCGSRATVTAGICISTGAENQTAFLTTVGVHGARGSAAQGCSCPTRVGPSTRAGRHGAARSLGRGSERVLR